MQGVLIEVALKQKYPDSFTCVTINASVCIVP